MQLQDIKHLAVLARLDISDTEAEGLLGDLKEIIAYIDQVTRVTVSGTEVDVPEHRNVAREDTVTNPGGQYTEIIMEDVPEKQDGYVKVNKIL
ncbi:MAG: Asp-tRNA(Asn)/Glu-tRNA(Gln) amidotransferase subunit GatC [bacterium]